jgi:hypothetical protein
VRNKNPFLIVASVIGALACVFAGATSTQAQSPVTPSCTEPVGAGTLQEISALYRKLIEAENRHDVASVRTMVWNSPSTLFVAKTATAAQGNWAGFWGIDVVLEHPGDLYEAGPFRIDPDYSKEKVVGLTADVAETYAPVNITVAYAGQNPVPKPFLMILEWVRAPEGWRMATDIALPIPPPPNS